MDTPTPKFVDYGPKSTTMNAKEIEAWRAAKIADGTWKGDTTKFDAKYGDGKTVTAKPDAKVVSVAVKPNAPSKAGTKVI